MVTLITAIKFNNVLAEIIIISCLQLLASKHQMSFTSVPYSGKTFEGENFHGSVGREHFVEKN